jgi:prolipoprotein diacylglyceryltransferase
LELENKLFDTINKGGLSSHCGLAIYIIKKIIYFKAKEELWKLKYFTIAQNNLQNNPLEETQNPSTY